MKRSREGAELLEAPRSRPAPGDLVELKLTPDEVDALTKSERCQPRIIDGIEVGCGHLMLIHNRDEEYGWTCNIPECGCSWLE